jgi:hypothetical protein
MCSLRGPPSHWQNTERAVAGNPTSVKYYTLFVIVTCRYTVRASTGVSHCTRIVTSVVPAAERFVSLLREERGGRAVVCKADEVV